MDNYTAEEIKNEIAILKKSFYQVRLVDPIVCQIMEFENSNGRFTLIPSGTCYDSWFYSNQCTNCTSSRALRTGHIQSKCETCNNALFYITARPVLIEDRPLILEIIQPMSYPASSLHHSGEDDLSSRICSINRKILLDTETSAYNREYLAEHLPNIFTEAQNQHTVNTALVRLNTYDAIQKQYGSAAATGIICRLYDILHTALSFSVSSDTILVRYQNDTFFVIDRKHNCAQFSACIRSIQEQSDTQHILYQSSLLSFELETAVVSLNEEQIYDSGRLFARLEELLSPA